MEIPKELKDEIWQYCHVNDITNIGDFNLKCLKQGFTVEKYGATPTSKEKIIEKIVEKIIEIPIEKVIEKIITVEVPINIIDTDVIQKLKDCSTSIETLKFDLTKANEINEELKKELDEEKKRNKNRDFYGER